MRALRLVVWGALVASCTTMACRRSDDVRAYCERESACTGGALAECLADRKEAAEGEGACLGPSQAVLRCLTTNATCKKAGTMGYLHPGDACRRETDALATCRSRR